MAQPLPSPPRPPPPLITQQRGGGGRTMNRLTDLHRFAQIFQIPYIPEEMQPKTI